MRSTMSSRGRARPESKKRTWRADTSATSARFSCDMPRRPRHYLSIALTSVWSVMRAPSAVVFPVALLASKDTVPSAAADVRMREVGGLLACIGVIDKLSGLLPNAVLHWVLQRVLPVYGCAVTGQFVIRANQLIAE